MSREPMRDVVVLLPGILGSVLQRDGRDVWAMSPGVALRALTSLGGSMSRLALEGDDPEADDLGDGVVATRVIPDLHLIPGLWKIDGYGAIAAAVRDRFDVTPGENYFEFAYDWRRDNRAHARRLARESHDWLAAWRTRSGNDDARLVLLAHSMGGLVARAFLELHDGWKVTRTLVTFGTPYRGSLNAVDFVANGFKKGWGPLGVDLGGVLRSLTSVYQLLPIYPVVETEAGPVRVTETAIPHLDAERAEQALAFHRSVHDAVDRNRTDPAYLERGYRTYPVVGIGQPTRQGVRVVDGGLSIGFDLGGRDHGGDGTVPRVSAMPIEMEDAATGLFSTAIHSSLQNADAVIAQVTGILTSADIDLRIYRSDGRGGISLQVPDAITAGTPLLIEARPAGGRSEPLTAAVVDTDSGAPVWQGGLADGVDWQRAETPPLAAGVYRLTVTGTPGSVSDLVVALPPAD